MRRGLSCPARPRSGPSQRLHLSLFCHLWALSGARSPSSPFMTGRSLLCGGRWLPTFPSPAPAPRLPLGLECDMLLFLRPVPAQPPEGGRAPLPLQGPACPCDSWGAHGLGSVLSLSHPLSGGPGHRPAPVSLQGPWVAGPCPLWDPRPRTTFSGCLGWAPGRGLPGCVGAWGEASGLPSALRGPHPQGEESAWREALPPLLASPPSLPSCPRGRVSCLAGPARLPGRGLAPQPPWTEGGRHEALGAPCVRVESSRAAWRQVCPEALGAWARALVARPALLAASLASSAGRASVLLHQWFQPGCGRLGSSPCGPSVVCCAPARPPHWIPTAVARQAGPPAYGGLLSRTPLGQPPASRRAVGAQVLGWALDACAP